MSSDTTRLQAKLKDAEALVASVRAQLAAVDQPRNPFSVGQWLADATYPNQPFAWQVTKLVGADFVQVQCFNRARTTVLSDRCTEWTVTAFRPMTPEELAGPAPLKVGDVVVNIYACDPKPLNTITKVEYRNDKWFVAVSGPCFASDIAHWQASTYRLATNAEKRRVTHFVPKVGMLLTCPWGHVCRVGRIIDRTAYLYSLDPTASWGNPELGIPFDEFTRDRFTILDSYTVEGVKE